MNKETPSNHNMQSPGAGANTSLLPIPRTIVNRLVSIQHKIRQSGLLLVDVADLAGLRFTSVYALVYLGLIGHAELERLETLFSEEGISHVQ